MKNLFYSTIIFFLFTYFTSHAQNKTSEIRFGRINIEDLKAKTYKIDSSAASVVLYEKGETWFGYDENMGFFYQTDVHVRRKILKPAAFDKGTLKLNYYQGTGNSSQRYSKIEGTTYWLENGGIQKKDLSKSDIFDEKITTTRHQKKITFPNIKEGVIIEYKYSFITPFQTRNTPAPWYFQGYEPTLWSEYEITIPSHFYYQVTVGGYLPLAVSDKSRSDANMGHNTYNTYGMKYRMAIADAPAFKEEKFMAAADNYLSKVEFELSSVNIPGGFTKDFSSTWEAIDRTLNQSEYFGLRLKKTGYLKEIVKNFENFPVGKEKLEKVYYYMNKQLKTEGSDYSVFVEDLKKIFESKKGSSTEQNMIMVSLLREMGFNANPVILSTRNNGKINQAFPILDRFNYVIAKVNLDNQIIYLDISDPNLKMGILPYQCLNGDAREISKEGGQFVDLSNGEKYKYYEEITAQLDQKKNQVTGKYQISSSGYHALELLSDYKKKGEDGYKNYIKSQKSDFEIDNIQTENFENSKDMLKLSYNFKSESTDLEQDVIYINPLLAGKITENPFNFTDRAYPLDFGYKQELTSRCVIKLPNEYKPENLFPAVNITNSDKTFQFIYSVTYNEEKNELSTLSRINIRDSFYVREFVHEFKELYARIIQKHDEMVVLKKIN